MVVVAVAPAALLVAGAAAAGSAAAAGTVCQSETYQWTGEASLGTGESVSTGVTVPAVAGTDLVAVGASADGVSPDGLARPLDVVVGGRPVQPGAVLDGGEIVVSHVGDGTVTVSGASVVVDRCRLVESAAATAERLPAVAPDERPTAPSAPSAPGDGSAAPTLPTTGASPVAVSALAAALLVAGLALRRASRPASAAPSSMSAERTPPPPRGSASAHTSTTALCADAERRQRCRVSMEATVAMQPSGSSTTWS